MKPTWLQTNRLFDLEGRREPLASTEVFQRRMIRSGAFTVIVIGVSLVLGMAGYHWIAGLSSWVDCLYNAAMILGGMGPVSEMHSDAAKIFASLYAIYSGVVLLASVGLLLTPALHRLLHRFHVETEDGS